jgi:hypothetical protein
MVMQPQLETTSGPPAQAAPPSGRFRLDRFTLGIAAAAVVLVAALFILVLRQPAATLADETTPSGVVHNYYLALQQKATSRAYDYLTQDTRAWLTYEQFTSLVSARAETRSVRITDERVEDGTAVVTVALTRYFSSGPFSTSEMTTSQSLVLRREAVNWRIALPQPSGWPYVPFDVYGW